MFPVKNGHRSPKITLACSLGFVATSSVYVVKLLISKTGLRFAVCKFPGWGCF